MKIVKLTATNFDDCKTLFSRNNSPTTSDYLVDNFANIYLSGLNSFHCVGQFDDTGILKGVVSFYEDINDPSWYITNRIQSRNSDNMTLLLDTVIKHQENNRRLKFYTLLTDSIKLKLGKLNTNRYDYYDEYIVPEKSKCFYTHAWEILFKRTLLPVESVVRCSFLKQEYRTKKMLGGPTNVEDDK